MLCDGTHTMGQDDLFQAYRPSAKKNVRLSILNVTGDETTLPKQ